MIKAASSIWGFSDPQDINSFDPIVGMLIGALAEELYNVEEEIKLTDARIVERLFELLLNENLFIHFPAHAMAMAKPTQSVMSVSELYHFSIIKKIPKTVNRETVYENKTVYFTPTVSTNLVDAEIKYLAAGHILYAISDNSKDPVADTVYGNVPDFSKIYIGLKTNDMIEKLDGLSFMFTLRNNQKEEWFLSSVAAANWKINNTKVHFRQGFTISGRNDDNALTEILRKNSDVMYQALSNVNEFYQHRFMFLENGNYLLKDISKHNGLPDEIRRNFPPAVTKTISGEICWVEIDLPMAISDEMIRDLNVYVNCFPVINRELNEFSQSITQGINIIPLRTNDKFFDIKSITDTKGTKYKHMMSHEVENPENESFIIQQEGISRFDPRDARQSIHHLISLIRDERAGFAELGPELISSELKQLDQIISRLKQRMEDSNISDEPNSYVILNCKSGYERASIQFWSTSGTLANDIRSGSKLTVQKGRDLDTNSVFLMTNTFGGAQKLSKDEKMKKLRMSLLSKGRIVTQEDIKALCFDFFGPELLRVEIKKGVHIDNAPANGLIRTIDIHLYLDKPTDIEGTDLKNKIDSLKIKLKQDSTNLMPFRFFSHKNP